MMSRSLIANRFYLFAWASLAVLMTPASSRAQLDLKVPGVPDITKPLREKVTKPLHNRLTTRPAEVTSQSAEFVPASIDDDGKVWSGSTSGSGRGAYLGQADLEYDDQGRAWWVFWNRKPLVARLGPYEMRKRAPARWDRASGGEQRRDIGSPAHVASVKIFNPTQDPIIYHMRYSDQVEWMRETLAPGSHRVYNAAMPARWRIRFDNNGQSQEQTLSHYAAPINNTAGSGVPKPYYFDWRGGRLGIHEGEPAAASAASTAGGNPTPNRPDSRSQGVRLAEEIIGAIGRGVEQAERRRAEERSRPSRSARPFSQQAAPQPAAPHASPTATSGARPSLGIFMQPVRLSNGQAGLQIQRVEPSGPAQRAGLESGDIIVRVDGAPVAQPDQLRQALARSDGRPRLTLINVRDGQPVDIGVPLD